MTKCVILCFLLLTQAGKLSAQNGTNVLFGLANNNTNGQFNTSVGYLENIPGIDNYAPYTFGTKNTYVGSNSGNYGTGSENSTLGAYAGGWKMSGTKNVFIGANAAANALRLTASSNVGTGNTIMGYAAGFQNQTDYNVFLGYQSGYSNVTGTNNVFVGTSTGYANTGSSNTFLGHQAGQSNTTGSNNLFLGWLSGQANTTGLLNTFVGGYTGYSNTTGQLNTFLGYATGSNNTSGRVNTFLGGYAGENNTSGLQNTFVGYQAGQATTTGNNNTITGYQAGQNVTTGNNNILIGPKSGTAVTTGSDNVLLGYNSQVSGSDLVNAVAIGTNARVAISNAIVLGDPTNTSIAVGIGTNSPQFPLDVRGTINLRNNGRIKFAHLSNPVREGTTDQFLTVNEVGETVLAKHRLRINNASEWSDKVFETGYTLKSLAEVGQYIQVNKHLPGIPSAAEVVEQGIDAAKMNANLLEKIEELTLYSIQLERSDQEQKVINQKQQERIEQLERLVHQLLEKK